MRLRAPHGISPVARRDDSIKARHEGARRFRLQLKEDSMNRITIAAAATGLTLLAGGAWLYQRADATEVPAYRLAAVERGTLRSTVSATGKLGAQRTVQVGTQVSGQVAALFVDFN